MKKRRKPEDLEWPKPSWPYRRLLTCNSCSWTGMSPDYFWMPPHGWIISCPKCSKHATICCRYKAKAARRKS